MLIAHVRVAGEGLGPVFQLLADTPVIGQTISIGRGRLVRVERVETQPHTEAVDLVIEGTLVDG
ncbi:MAG TPA: hypothetical protein VJ689_02170 [Gaiellaceae bacterium]|nr:hypothetical protein [Gaiellaceae bacterium]